MFIRLTSDFKNANIKLQLKKGCDEDGIAKRFFQRADGRCKAAKSREFLSLPSRNGKIFYYRVSVPVLPRYGIGFVGIRKAA